MAEAPILFQGGGRTVPLSVVRKAGMRRMNLRIDERRGAVRLTLPRHAPLGDAMAWVEEKRPWVERQLARIPAGDPIGPDMLVPLGDAQYRLDWVKGAPRTPRMIGDTIQLGGEADGLAPRLTRWLKAEALARLTRETKQLAERHGLPLTRVSIGDPVSRWGSCSANGAIRYSWRLILAPDFVLRSTVAHEAAHLVHMNHSPAFHALAAELLGEDPKRARAWLRENGPRLQRWGR